MTDKLELYEINNDKITIHIRGHSNNLKKYKNIFETLSVPTFLDRVTSYSESSPVSFDMNDNSYPESNERVLILTFDNKNLAEKKINEMFELLSKVPTLKESYIKTLQAAWNKQLSPYHIHFDFKNTLQTMQETMIEAFYKANTDSPFKNAILPVLPSIAHFVYGKERVNNYKIFPSCRFFKNIENKNNDTNTEYYKTCIIS